MLYPLKHLSSQNHLPIYVNGFFAFLVRKVTLKYQFGMERDLINHVEC